MKWKTFALFVKRKKKNNTEYDWYTNGKSQINLHILEEAVQIPLKNYDECGPPSYLCRSCVQKSKRMTAAKQTFLDLKTLFQNMLVGRKLKSKRTSHDTSMETPTAKKSLEFYSKPQCADSCQESVVNVRTFPVSVETPPIFTTTISSQFSDASVPHEFTTSTTIKPNRQNSPRSQNTTVTITFNKYPSKTTTKELEGDFEAIGKVL